MATTAAVVPPSVQQLSSSPAHGGPLMGGSPSPPSGGEGRALSLTGSGHTIHPKLSLSAKRSVSSMTAGATANNVVAGTSASFQLTVAFNNAESGAPISFKQDGNRFATSQRTLKLQSNCKYKVAMKCRPAQDFLSLHIGGSDVELVCDKPSSGDYSATWNTTGIDPSKKGARQDILFILSGPGKSLSRKLQTKFYAREDSHAVMGHRVDALCWSCEVDPMGQVAVTDEKLL